MIKSSAHLLVALCSLSAGAEVRLPRIISDHAVLQRERPIHLWGWATPGARLSARFHGQQVATAVDTLGKWSLYLDPEKAGGPYDLTVSGDGPEIKVSDLLVGDVWFASGQSNMEMPLRGFGPGTPVKDGDREIAAAANPKLRLLLIEHATSTWPQRDITGTWTECTPETAKNFSAVAYFFGREIASRENVPVGLIDSTWGGTAADAWMSLDTLGTDPRLLPAFASRAALANEHADQEAMLASEKRADAAANAAGKPAPPHASHPDEAAWRPAGLYNGMIAPFTPLTIRGFLWYQGESNSSADRAPVYDTLFSALIGDWRTHFAQGTLPFLFVQISSFSSPRENWGLLREQQRRTLAVTNTAMAVTLDVGNAGNVHPSDKQTVGSRLALAARALVYGEDVAYRGPEFREATEEAGAMRVWFDHAQGLRSQGAGESAFEIAGEDRRYLPAQAAIIGESVRVSTPAVPNPRYVRFAWTGVVTNYLVNSSGLPASTFSSEKKPSP